MKYPLLFAISLVLVIPAARAQQQTPANVNPPQAIAASDVPSATQPKLTPRQVAELRADLLFAQKEYPDAIRAYKKILETDPNSAQVLDKIGVCYQQTLDLGQAERYYKKAAKTDKTFASAINNIGTVEYERKHYGKAVKWYKKALKIRTDMATVYTNLGYAYFEQKHYLEAMSSFHEALMIDPTVFDRRGEGGAIVQQRSTSDPGLFYFYVAKSYALAGDAEHAAHFLKLARDDGYKEFASAQTDPSFTKVIKDKRIQEVLTVSPSYEADQHKIIKD